MPDKTAPKLGKLSQAILENFVKSNLGEDFVKELRSGYDRKAVLGEALKTTEERFLKEFPDKDISKAMFVDLSQQDRPSLTNAIGRFYDRPTDPDFQQVLSEILLGEFTNLSHELVDNAVMFYVKILTEELAMLDSDFREKANFLKNFRTTQPQPTAKASKQPAQKKQKAGAFQVPPIPPQGVFGRDEELKNITNLLMLKEKESENLAPISLRGMGGIGKTTLAIAFAHLPEIHATLPDGILWTSLGPKPTVRLLLDAWGRALGLDLLPERDESACQARLRQALYERHMLIVVDDVWDTIQGNYFNVGGPHCRTIFTTREVPIANNLATKERTLRVDVLKPEAALSLLYKLAPETAQVEKKLALRLCERLEFLPLGLTLAGRMLANEVDIPQRMQRLLSELVERREARLQLWQAEGRPGLDEENPVSIQSILGMSVERLSKPDQERFAMLSVFGGEPLTWEIKAVSSVWECKEEETEETVSKFIQRGLIEPQGNHFWMHALLADYAAEMMVQMDL